MNKYYNDPKFSDRQVLANSVDPDPEEQSDQGLHSLPFCLASFGHISYDRVSLFKF